MKLPAPATGLEMTKLLKRAKKQGPPLDVLWRGLEFLCPPGFM
jgi:hypothetical protein